MPWDLHGVKNTVSRTFCLTWTTENDLQRFLKEFNKETKNHSKGSLLHRQGDQLEYSKHPHIRTLILEVRLIRFLYIGCLVKNQPEGVLKLFLKIGGGNQNCNKYTKKSLRLN